MQEVTKRFRSKMEQGAVMDAISQRIEKNFEGGTIVRAGNKITYKGRVKESVLTNTISCDITVNVIPVDGGYKVTATVETGTRWTLWALLIIGLFLWVPFLIGAGLYFYQKGKPAKTTGEVLAAAEDHCSDF